MIINDSVAHFQVMNVIVENAETSGKSEAFARHEERSCCHWTNECGIIMMSCSGACILLKELHLLDSMSENLR